MAGLPPSHVAGPLWAGGLSKKQAPMGFNPQRLNPPKPAETGSKFEAGKPEFELTYPGTGTNSGRWAPAQRGGHGKTLPSPFGRGSIDEL